MFERVIFFEYFQNFGVDNFIHSQNIPSHYYLASYRRQLSNCHDWPTQDKISVSFMLSFHHRIIDCQMKTTKFSIMQIFRYRHKQIERRKLTCAQNLKLCRGGRYKTRQYYLLPFRRKINMKLNVEWASKSWNPFRCYAFQFHTETRLKQHTTQDVIYLNI